MELVVSTEYQDVYRIKYGVLLIVNKFELDYKYGELCVLYNAKSKSYNKLTKGIRVLREDSINRELGSGKTYSVPKGTILKNGRPIKATSKQNWIYEIKTAGDCFCGNSQDILKDLEKVRDIINKAKE